MEREEFALSDCALRFRPFVTMNDSTSSTDPQRGLEELAELFEQSEREEVGRNQLDQLVSRALAYRTGGELRALLEFAKRFPHVAPFNAMLLHVQNPGIGTPCRRTDGRGSLIAASDPVLTPM